MFIKGIKIPKWNQGLLLFVEDFVRICIEVVSMTDLVFTTRKLCIKSYGIGLTEIG